jgi:ABC-type glycerol-3-phosphate transport system permease component
VPAPVLLLLILLVGIYVVLAGIAVVGFIMARRQEPPPDPPEWPSVSVVVPAYENPDHEAVQQIQACTYPTDRLEILVPAPGSAEDSSRGDERATVRRIPVSDQTSGAPASTRVSEGIEAAEGEVVLSVPTEGTVPSGWIRSMVRRCTPDTPVVVGPTIVAHEGLFLPRLQALSHLGRLAFTAGLSHVGMPSPVEASNRAARVDASPPDSANDAATGHIRGAFPPTINPEAEAVVARPPVSSFEAFLRRLAQGFRRTLHSASWLVWGQGIGLWLLHSVLLACSLVAVSLPAWRQPTLLALLALMLTNVVLALPVAKHYGQRGLLRSVVPTVLMLVLALPLAGLWALVNHAGDSTPAPPPGT